jgi:hypothetical protein
MTFVDLSDAEMQLMNHPSANQPLYRVAAAFFTSKDLERLFASGEFMSFES